ncbi:MAG TPA: aldo/keto reductase [Desulfosporosinus sp.]|nr:aldo/keto reductase [Desulfosporosinus sp.]
MRYRTLGKTGVQVSNLCFGTMSFGDAADEESSKAMFKRCREADINFFDCADVYSDGRAEEILGRCIKDCREELVITSKVCGKTGDNINDRGLSRRHIQLGVEESLKRLGTDRIDIYFLHKFDDLTDIEETLRALENLLHQGKILYSGVSNWAAWQIEKALGISARQGLSPFSCIQPMYNLVKRQAESEILPMAAEENLGVITYSPLGGGLLTGKYTTHSKPNTGRLIQRSTYEKRYGDGAYYQVAENFTNYAKERGYHPATLAVAWVMEHSAITAPIIGARNVEQLEVSLAAANLNMTKEWRAEITSLSITPAPATDRSEEVK